MISSSSGTRFTIGWPFGPTASARAYRHWSTSAWLLTRICRTRVWKACAKVAYGMSRLYWSNLPSAKSPRGTRSPAGRRSRPRARRAFLGSAIDLMNRAYPAETDRSSPAIPIPPSNAEDRPPSLLPFDNALRRSWRGASWSETIAARGLRRDYLGEPAGARRGSEPTLGDRQRQTAARR